MASKLKRILLFPIRNLFSGKVRNAIIKRFSKDLIKELLGKMTDKFLELLLKSMDLAFYLSKSYRKNIEGFKGRYLFRTIDNIVTATATFNNGDMKVHKDAKDDWDIRITFKDSAALRAFIFSKDQDILDSILKNDVEVDGNLNYIYKFGFMARDLSRRLGIG